MKVIIMFSCLLIMNGQIFGQSKTFHEQVLSRFNCENCYFIPINVKSETFTGRIVVENDELFDYLKATRGFNKQSYTAFMLSVLQDNQELVMKDVAVDDSGLFLVGENLEKYSFRIVETSQAFEVVSSQGCEYLVRYYFSPPLPERRINGSSGCKDTIRQNAKDLFMKPRYDITEQNNVISKLFDIGIPIYLDDISGSLKISYFTLK